MGSKMWKEVEGAFENWYLTGGKAFRLVITARHQQVLLAESEVRSMCPVSHLNWAFEGLNNTGYGVGYKEPITQWIQYSELIW